jgi:hypothetical protein
MDPRIDFSRTAEKLVNLRVTKTGRMAGVGDGPEVRVAMTCAIDWM